MSEDFAPLVSLGVVSLSGVRPHCSCNTMGAGSGGGGGGGGGKGGTGGTKKWYQHLQVINKLILQVLVKKFSE